MVYRQNQIYRVKFMIGGGEVKVFTKEEVLIFDKYLGENNEILHFNRTKAIDSFIQTNIREDEDSCGRAIYEDHPKLGRVRKMKSDLTPKKTTTLSIHKLFIVRADPL